MGPALPKHPRRLSTASSMQPSRARVNAYSANGTTGCSGSPTICVPLWTYATGSMTGTISVVNGMLFADGGPGLQAFDANGQIDCSGTPTVCQPVWEATVNAAEQSPTVSNGSVFVTTQVGDIEAFDAAGGSGCSGAPRICSPLWISHVAGPTSSIVSVSNGILFARGSEGGTGTIVALDASGTRGCGGTPKVCTPLWAYATTYSPKGFPVVSGTTLYVDTDQLVSVFPNLVEDGNIEAFDANGVKGCAGTPVVCAPIWSSQNTLPSGVSPVVGNGVAIVPGLHAFDAQGVTDCSRSSCSPLWSTSTAGSPSAMGGSVLYASSGTNIDAYDAGGASGCSGSPIICSPLWSAPGATTIVATGTVYVGTADSSGNREIVAYGLS